LFPNRKHGRCLNRKSPTPDFEESERTMTTSKRLAAFHAAQSGDDFAETDPTRPEDEEDESTANHKEGTKKKEKPMADEPVSAAEHASAIADATAKATEAANARFSAVLASEHYKGREALATNLLGKVTASGKYAFFDPALATGVELPENIAILFHPIDASAADVKTVGTLRGPATINGNMLTYKAGMSAPNQIITRNALRSKGMAVLPQHNGE